MTVKTLREEILKKMVSVLRNIFFDTSVVEIRCYVAGHSARGAEVDFSGQSAQR